MVLESLITPANAEKRPWQMMILGFLFALVGVILANVVFRGQASIVSVFFTTVACIPIIYNTLKLEEDKDEKIKNQNEFKLLKEHYKALQAFMFLFIGATIAFTVIFIVTATFFPDTHISTFKIQVSTLSTINGKVVESFDGVMSSIGFSLVTGNVAKESCEDYGEKSEKKLCYLEGIISNNIKVCLYCILFSLFYGVGAIFILMWNASVIGTAMGKFIMESLEKLNIGITSFGELATYKVYNCAFFVRYLPHGLPEIASYFVAAIAGGILSVAIVRHRFGTRKFETIIIDCAILIIIALVLVFLSGIIEIYITPGLFSQFC